MAEKITKKDAVRKALTELGKDAMPAAIQEWVKDKFGIEMTVGHVSVNKSELLRGAKKELAPVTAEKPTKAEAVRLAIAELGKKADRVQIQGFVKDRFGIEMGLDHISTVKGATLRKSKKKAKASQKPSMTPEALPKEPASPSQGGIDVADLLTLKELIERVGADQMRTLMEVFPRR